MVRLVYLSEFRTNAILGRARVCWQAFSIGQLGGHFTQGAGTFAASKNNAAAKGGGGRAGAAATKTTAAKRTAAKQKVMANLGAILKLLC